MVASHTRSENKAHISFLEKPIVLRNLITILSSRDSLAL